MRRSPRYEAYPSRSLSLCGVYNWVHLMATSLLYPLSVLCVSPQTCYDSAECHLPQICDMDLYECVDPTPAPTVAGCCAGTSEAASGHCNAASSHSNCERMSSCYWVEGEYADCEWKDTSPPTDPGCCMIVVTISDAHPSLPYALTVSI